MRKFVFFSVLKSSTIFCSTFAIVGGQDNSSSDGYVALISPTGETSFPTNLDQSTLFAVQGVAINSLGAAIIGGNTQTSDAFYTLISPSGVAFTPPSGPASPVGSGAINAVAINSSGAGIIGGIQHGNMDPYAALVAANGDLTALSGATPTGTGNIISVAINDNGDGIIGGYDESSDTPYVGLVASSGTVTSMTVGSQPLPSGTGEIFSVDINAFGSGIVGGTDCGFSHLYVALLSPSGVTSAISGPALPVGNGYIGGVAINDLGNAIIGGSDNSSSDAYAALVDSSGVTKALTGGSGLPVGGAVILSVAINNSGAAVIGGDQNSTNDPYAAMVTPDGVLISLTGEVPLPGGWIQSVAINEAGVAIIGGQDNGNSDLYMALVSPSGVATKMTGMALPTPGGYMNSVAIGPSALNSVVPASWGPGSSFANTLFAFAADLLPNHLQWQHHSPQPEGNQEVGLLADASDVIRKPLNNQKYTVWGSLFGDYAHQKQYQSIPTLNQWLGGAILGFDYWGVKDALLGCGAAYAYSYVHLGQQLGHSNSNQGFLTLYGSYYRDHFYLDGAVWGGYYSLFNERHTVGFITSTAKTHGWLLSPHLEVGFPIYSKKEYVFAPFAMLDWANNWQHAFKEKGKSGLNLVMPSQYTSLLRSEAGIRFFQTFHLSSGDLILEEKGSYVNKAPFHVQSLSTFFVGSASTFNIEMFSNQLQNLGAVQFSFEYLPQSKWPNVSLNYQGEFGSSFQNQLISLEISKDF